jgi:hypothetical protein
VSDTQAYRQFGNSVVVPVFAAVAKLLAPRIAQAGNAPPEAIRSPSIGRTPAASADEDAAVDSADRQNSVVVPVFAAVAKLLAPRIAQAVALREADDNDGGCDDRPGYPTPGCGNAPPEAIRSPSIGRTPAASADVAKLLAPRIAQAVALREADDNDGGCSR